MRTTNIHEAPAFRLALLLILGIIAGTIVPRTSPWGWIAVSLLGLGSLLLASVGVFAARGSLLSPVLAVAVCLLAGMSKGIVDRQRGAGASDSTVTGRFLVVGRICDPPTTIERQTRFTLSVEGIRRGDGWQTMAENSTVTIVRSHADSVQLRLEYGMRIVLAGELARPPDARNPGEFSPRRYYEANGISLALFVRGCRNVVVLDSSGGSWLMRQIVIPARRRVLADIDRAVGGEPGELLKGLLIGDRSGIPITTRQAFVNAGVAHVLAVSGSNVAVVATVLVLLLGFFPLPEWLRCSAVAAGVVLYMMLTGNQPPVVRATIMALVVLLGKILQRKPNAYNALGISALIILALDSRQLYDVGFQLSFGAVLSIVYLYPRMNALISRLDSHSGVRRGLLWLLRLCSVSLAATLGTLPLTALVFGRVSIIGILANIVVIPATSLSVVIGFVSSFFMLLSEWVGSVYATVNSGVLRCTLAITEFSGGLPFAYVDTLRFRPIDAVPFYALLFLFVYIGRPVIARRLLVLVLIGLNLAILWPGAKYPVKTRGILRVSVLDVGEGDAMLVEFPRGETMLVDAGPRTGASDAGERVVVPFLRRFGISRIDLLVLTHPHSDHLGGIPSVLNSLEVRRVVDSGQAEGSSLYAEYLHAVQSSGARHLKVGKGDILEVSSEARVFVLSPDSSLLVRDSSGQNGNLNNTSIALRVVYGQTSILLAGDAERAAEEAMVQAYGGFLESSMLKAGHHGSSTSSGGQFVTTVRPSVVAISVGKHNKFRHPSSSVIRRLESMGVQLMRTDDDGAIMLESDGVGFAAVHWR